MINKNVFYCYSKPLKNFLLDNGERYILKSSHDRTKKVYWIFLSGDSLNALLSKWRENKIKL